MCCSAQPLKFAQGLGRLRIAVCFLNARRQVARPVTFTQRDAQGNNWRESWNIIIRQIKSEYKIANSAERAGEREG